MVCCTGVLGAKTRSGWIATALVPLLCHYDIIQLQYHTAMAYYNTNHGLLSPYILSSLWCWGQWPVSPSVPSSVPSQSLELLHSLIPNPHE